MSFFEMFNPGMRYLREEKDRQKMLVSKPTHGGGAPLGIDLDGGIATITIKAKTPPEDVPADDPAAEATTEHAADTPAEDASAGPGTAAAD